MINIHGLTQDQCDMMDIIWSFKTKDEYLEWFETLDSQDANTARGLMELLCLAILEDEMGDSYKAQAKQVIQKIQSKFDTK